MKPPALLNTTVPLSCCSALSTSVYCNFASSKEEPRGTDTWAIFQPPIAVRAEVRVSSRSRVRSFFSVYRDTIIESATACLEEIRLHCILDVVHREGPRNVRQRGAAEIRFFLEIIVNEGFVLSHCEESRLERAFLGIFRRSLKVLGQVILTQRLQTLGLT